MRNPKTMMNKMDECCQSEGSSSRKTQGCICNALRHICTKPLCRIVSSSVHVETEASLNPNFMPPNIPLYAKILRIVWGKCYGFLK
jgi:hypothetical protein